MTHDESTRPNFAGDSTHNLSQAESPPASASAQPSHHTDAIIGRGVVGEVRLIPPHLIRIATDPNRDAASFASEDFSIFRDTIHAAGVNTEPITARRVLSQDDALELELVCGHRRHRACLDLGLHVRVIVEPDCDDTQACQRRLQENSGRADLSPWELGHQIADGVRNGHLRSTRHAATVTGRDPSDLAKAVHLASLEPRVVAAFQSTADLQYRHAKPLSDAIKADRGAVVAEAERIAQMHERPPANEVLALLMRAAGIGVGRSHTPIPDRPLEAAGQLVGRMKCNRSDALIIEIDVPLAERERESLARQVEKFMGRKLEKVVAVASEKPEVSQ